MLFIGGEYMNADKGLCPSLFQPVRARCEVFIPLQGIPITAAKSPFLSNPKPLSKGAGYQKNAPFGCRTNLTTNPFIYLCSGRGIYTYRTKSVEFP